MGPIRRSDDTPTGVVETCWQSVETKDATLECTVSGVLNADRTRLAQLFENLIRNAIEHGGADVTVTVGSLADGIYVADDGPGIPAEKRSDVFASGYSSRETGTGFGLAIVATIADAHGWEITVTESDTGGTRFEFTDVEFVDR